MNILLHNVEDNPDLARRVATIRVDIIDDYLNRIGLSAAEKKMVWKYLYEHPDVLNNIDA
jgi:hypothetical protein